MIASTSVDTFGVGLSPAIGQEGSSTSLNTVSVTASRHPSDIGHLTDWRSAIISRYRAFKELEARRTAKPEPLIRSSSMTGFGAPLAGGQALSSNNFRSSGSDEHVSTGPVRRALLTRDSVDMQKLEERRRKLSDDADECQGSSLGLEPAATQLSGHTINLATSPRDEPSSFEHLEEAEAVNAQPAAQACATCIQCQAINADASSSPAWDLQHSPNPSSPTEPADPSPPSSSFSSSSCDFVEMLSQPVFRRIPANTSDNGGSPAAETSSRCKPRPPPRIKINRARHSNQAIPAIRQPLLSRTSSARTPIAANAADVPMHPDVPLQDVDMQPCCGVCQRLSSSLSAVWRWLCKSGSGLVKLGRKVLKQLMTALGVCQEEEVQSMLVAQQTEEREALAVRAYRPQNPVEESWGPSRLQRWRV